MRLPNHITISICENNNQGRRSGKAHHISIDSYSGESCLNLDAKDLFGGVRCFTDSGRIVEIHDNRFKFTHFTDWVGNISWNAYHFPPDYALGLINLLLRSRQWDISEGWAELIQKYERGELITGLDLELDDDYQPLTLNPNQFEIPFFNHQASQGVIKIRENMNSPQYESTKYDGKRGKVIAKNHPHHNSIAVCKGAAKTGLGWGIIFKREDTKEEFFIFDGKDIQWIDL